MRKMVHHLKRTRAGTETDTRTVLELHFQRKYRKSPKIKLMEIKLTAGEIQDPVHTAIDPPNKQRRLRRQALRQYSPTHGNSGTQKTAMCLYTERKNCRDSIQNTKMVIQKPS